MSSLAVEVIEYFATAHRVHEEQGLTPYDKTALYWARFNEAVQERKVTCCNCGVVFSFIQEKGNTGNRKYCSEWCSEDARNARARERRKIELHVKTCQCGKVFQPKRSFALYCSRLCKDRASRKTQ